MSRKASRRQGDYERPGGFDSHDGSDNRECASGLNFPGSQENNVSRRTLMDHRSLRGQEATDNREVEKRPGGQKTTFREPSSQ